MKYVKAFGRSLLGKEGTFMCVASYILILAFCCTAILEYYCVLAIIKQLSK